MRKNVSIVGGGAAALMLACELNPQKFNVTLYEKNKQPARKFLVAGDGGFNLTHSENEELFIKRYQPNNFLKAAFHYFSNKNLVAWLQQLGIKTFTGSSGRVFPEKGIKPVEVLDAFLYRLKEKGVQIKSSHEWQGFSASGALLFKSAEKTIEVKSDVTIFCLGGGSWSVTGSNSKWHDFFKQKLILCQPFEASNCAFKVNWPQSFISEASGKALKNITLSCESKTHAGEVVVTDFGIEGSGIYPLSPELRRQLKTKGNAVVTIDLKPNLTPETILQRLSNKSAAKNLSDKLKHELRLSPLQIKLLKTQLSKEQFTDINQLATGIKHLPVNIIGPAPVDDGISTVGGIDLDELDENFQLKKLPQHYCIGEMLNYDAPTGGYLLQSCFSMGAYLANELNNN